MRPWITGCISGASVPTLSSSQRRIASRSSPCIVVHTLAPRPGFPSVPCAFHTSAPSPCAISSSIDPSARRTSSYGTPALSYGSDYSCASFLSSKPNPSPSHHPQPQPRPSPRPSLGTRSQAMEPAVGIASGIALRRDSQPLSSCTSTSAGVIPGETLAWSADTSTLALVCLIGRLTPSNRATRLTLTHFDASG